MWRDSYSATEPGPLCSARNVQTSSAISSVALDRGLFMLSGLIVMIVGLLTLIFVPSAPRALRICCSVTAIVLLMHCRF